MMVFAMQEHRKTKTPRRGENAAKLMFGGQLTQPKVVAWTSLCNAQDRAIIGAII